MIQQRAAEANKAALEAEKERDELHNQIEQIEEQLHPRLAKCGQLRRRLTCGLDTSGSASSGRFLVA